MGRSAFLLINTEHFLSTRSIFNGDQKIVSILVISIYLFANFITLTRQNWCCKLHVPNFGCRRWKGITNTVKIQRMRSQQNLTCRSINKKNTIMLRCQGEDLILCDQIGITCNKRWLPTILIHFYSVMKNEEWWKYIRRFVYSTIPHLEENGSEFHFQMK